MSALADKRQQGNLVVGLGRSGFSVVRHLAARGEAVAVVDSRACPPMLERLQAEFPEVQWLGSFPERLPEGVGRVIVSPGVGMDEPLLVNARADGVEVLGDVELFARLATAPILAVTGSNGKSTVVSLLAHLLRHLGRRAVAGGNLGRPALELLDEPADLYVLEVSSFQLESTHALNAAVGVVLNVTPDHLDRHGDMDAYAAAKARLVSQSRVAVLNLDDERVTAMAPAAKQRIGFGAGRPGAGDFGVGERDGTPWFMRGDEWLGPVSLPALPGEHNRLNVVAALAVIAALGESPAEALPGLADFRGLPHRMALVAEQGGVRWINDSKATNLGATLAALSGLKEAVVLIAGGQPKGQDFTPLGPALSRGVRGLVVLGEAAEAIAARAPAGLPLRRVADMSEAVNAAFEMACPGDSVLLSPACASFDLFEGFEARGQAFENAVHARLAAPAGGGA